jgi:hypothetical protein
MSPGRTCAFAARDFGPGHLTRSSPSSDRLRGGTGSPGRAGRGCFARLAARALTGALSAPRARRTGGLIGVRSPDWGMVDAVRFAVLTAVLLLAAPALAATWNEIEGTANADHIRGTAASDRIRGLGGNDVLRGWAGDDLLVGGPGDDLLKGGLGQDTYICGGGQDVVVLNFSRQTEQFGDGCEAVIFDA